MDQLTEKIKGMKLTKADKKIADFILENSHTVGLSTVREVAARIGVSDTSVIRFLRLLGFSGFIEFKKYLHEKMLAEYGASRSPKQKYDSTRYRIRPESVTQDVLTRAVENLQKMLMSVDESVVEEMAECLIHSRHKYIAGFRATAGCAEYFTRKLLFFLPHVVLCNTAESRTIESIVDIGKNDCLLLFSFPRYSKLSDSILAFAKREKAKILVVTDHATSPLASYADILLTVPIEGIGFANSYAVPLCMAEAITLLVGQKVGDKGGERLEKLDEMINQNQLY